MTLTTAAPVASVTPVHEPAPETLQRETLDLAHQVIEASRRIKTVLAEKERLSALLDTVLDQLDAGVALVADDGVVLAANRAAETLGLVVEGDDGARVRRLTPRVRLDDDAPQRPFGATGPAWSVRRGRVELPTGGQGDVVLVHDVTTLIRLGEEAQRRSRLVAVGRMAAELAHEVRNPLGSLELFASLMADDAALAPPTRELAEQIVLGVRRLAGVVETMLSATRGRTTRRAPVDAAALAREALSFVAPLAATRSIRVTGPAADETIPARLDRDAVEQALLNLLGNALDAAPAGGRVALAVTAHAGCIRFTVEDSGPGVPPALRERVLEPFFTTRAEGNGVGLAVVERVALAHGGGVHVDDSPTLGGARFCLQVLAEESA